MADAEKQIQVKSIGDTFLPEAGLWLDPHRPRDVAFVSHAHADHFAAHGKIITSAPTQKIIEARFGARKAEFLGLEFGEIHDLDNGFEVRMLPAGHIAGSAMLHITRKEDGATLLHTGDFKVKQGHAAEKCEPVHADTLIMETTFGLPKFCLPPPEETQRRMTGFAVETLEDGEIPILMAYSLGKAQEVIMALHLLAPELKFQVHSTVQKMNEVVREVGFDIPECGEFQPKERSPEGHVLIMPPSVARSQAVRKLRKKARVAMVTGWGVDSSAKYRYQADEVFPLSDHADYKDLHSFVEMVQPSRVFTIHGSVHEFARDLRAKGMEAWPLQGETQLELEMNDSTGSGDRTNRVESPGTPPNSGFGTFVRVATEIGLATGKLRKQKILADYLRQLEGETLSTVATFFTGSPFSKTSDTRAAKVGWAVIRRSLLEVSGLNSGQYRQISNSQADAARTAHLVLEGKTNPEPHEISDLTTFFHHLAEAKGPAAKIELLNDQLKRLHHSEGAFAIAILTGDLRIGLKEGLLEEAVAAAFEMAGKEVREANMLLGDIGRTAVLASEDRLGEAELTWFTPVKVMLASPEETAQDIFDRLGQEDGPGVWLEDKFDGIRAQLHKQGDRVEIFSRDLRPLHHQFPELIEPAKKIPQDVILDGEIIAYAEGKKLSFFDLQKRLGRRNQGDLFFGEAVPVRFIAFDLLGLDGRGVLNEPLKMRRQLLDTLDLIDPVGCCEVFFGNDPDGIDQHFNNARKRDNEGLIAKDPSSLYSPGRRGKTWLKLKKAMPTLDCVVVKAEQGHGKRAHVLSDYTFSVCDERTGELRVIGKAYSGLTDLEIEELTEYFKEHTIEKIRKAHVVTPNLVLEIAFDSINPSKRHDSGLAMRFPRIKAIRRDKTADDIDTLQYAQKLAGIKESA